METYRPVVLRILVVAAEVKQMYKFYDGVLYFADQLSQNLQLQINSNHLVMQFFFLYKDLAINGSYKINKVRNTVKHILVEIQYRHLSQFHSEDLFFLYTVSNSMEIQKWMHAKTCAQKSNEKPFYLFEWRS